MSETPLNKSAGRSPGDAVDAALPEDLQAQQANATAAGQPEAADVAAADVQELGGPAGPEPTRYGDWERKGRCIDF